MQLGMMTYRDAIDHLLDYGGSPSDAQTERFARRAVQLAMNTVGDDRNWTYYYQKGRLNSVAAYSTGTIAYNATGGSIERQITLTGGVWPSWAADGSMVINNVAYDIFLRQSDTIAQMATYANPGADIAAATAYQIYRDTFTLPIDFCAMDQMTMPGYSRVLGYQTPGQFVNLQRTQISPAQPYFYTITGDPRRFGALAIRFYPPPDAIYQFDYTYRRSPRQINVIGYETGKVSVASNSATLTGTGTAWTSAMRGAIIRLSSDTKVPTGVSGTNPATLERAVLSVDSATQITLDQASNVTLTNVAHSISDAIDIEPGAMLEYCVRSMERQYRIARRMKATPDEERQYNESRIMAFEADSRHYEDRNVYSNSIYPVRMASMPRGADQT